MNSPYTELLKLIREEYSDYEIISELNQTEVKEYSLENFLPEDVYPDRALEEWAESHGYVEE